MPIPNEELNQFKEGQSGNPAGRPKGSRNRSTIVREILELMEDTKNPITNAHEKLTQEQIMTLAVLSKARKGDVRAYQALMDSGYGSPNQQIETTTDGSIQIKIIRDNGNTPSNPAPSAEGGSGDSQAV